MSTLATSEEITIIRRLLCNSALPRAEDALSWLDRHVCLSYIEETLEHMTKIYSIRARLAIDAGGDHMGWPELIKGLELQLAAEPSAKTRLYLEIQNEAGLGIPLLIFTNSTNDQPTRSPGRAGGLGGSENFPSHTGNRIGKKLNGY